jgi:hypothetical protein
MIFTFIPADRPVYAREEPLMEHHLEHAEHAQHAAHDPFDRRVTMTIAIIAAMLACVTETYGTRSSQSHARD